MRIECVRYIIILAESDCICKWATVFAIISYIIMTEEEI